MRWRVHFLVHGAHLRPWLCNTKAHHHFWLFVVCITSGEDKTKRIGRCKSQNLALSLGQHWCQIKVSKETKVRFFFCLKRACSLCELIFLLDLKPLVALRRIHGTLKMTWRSHNEDTGYFYSGSMGETDCSSLMRGRVTEVIFNMGDGSRAENWLGFTFEPRPSSPSLIYRGSPLTPIPSWVHVIDDHQCAYTAQYFNFLPG